VLSLCSRRVVLSGISIGKYCVPVKLWKEPGCPSFFAEGLDKLTSVLFFCTILSEAGGQRLDDKPPGGFCM
jgi:hypothetical protein